MVTTSREIAKKGLSSDCKLDPLLIMAINIDGREHPCDRCNHNREKCRGYPKADEREDN